MPGKRSFAQKNAVDASDSSNALVVQGQGEYSAFTTETSSVLLNDDDEFDQNSAVSKSGKDDENENEPKRW